MAFQQNHNYLPQLFPGMYTELINSNLINMEYTSGPYQNDINKKSKSVDYRSNPSSQKSQSPYKEGLTDDSPFRVVGIKTLNKQSKFLENRIRISLKSEINR